LSIKRSFVKKIKPVLVALAVFLLLYLTYLNNIVRSEFSKAPIGVNLTYSDQSKVAINMLLLVEDQSYFQHHGVDFKEIARVIRDYLFYNKPMRGASTISQQLVKNTLLSREKTISRKAKEALMALMLELSFDKEFILNRYLNTVYLGQKGNLEVRGFNNGAKFYFNKDINDLSIEEVATLVALVKGPSYYHPIKHSQRLAKRRQLVLRMYKKYKKIVK